MRRFLVQVVFSKIEIEQLFTAIYFKFKKKRSMVFWVL